jgi:hypothetical protein
VLLCAVTLGAATRQCRPPTGVRLSLDPAVLSVGPGEHGTLELRVTGVPPAGLAAFQVTLAFDPSQIEVLDPNAEYVSAGVKAFASLGDSPFCTMVRGTVTCPDPPWMLTATGREAFGTTSIDLEEGVVTIAYGTAGDEPLPAGGGTLAVLEVVGVAGGPVSLEIIEGLLADTSDPPKTYAWSAP